MSHPLFLFIGGKLAPLLQEIGVMGFGGLSVLFILLN
jgi:hypothetical protein